MEAFVVLALLLGLIVLVVRLMSSSSGAGATETRSDSPPRILRAPEPRFDPSQMSKSGVEDRPIQSAKRPPRTPVKKPSPASQPSPRVREDKPVRLVPATTNDYSGYSLPKPPPEFGPGRWIAQGQPVTVAGILIPDGMVYVGSSLKVDTGENDPCLIDPSLPVAAAGDYTLDQMGYWPSYSRITPQARRAYLNWLSEGRKHPDTEIGFVFLFFYGLERRAIVDAAAGEAARYDRPRIAAEVRRLLDLYSEKSRSFKRYAGELLDWISLSDHPRRLYEQAIPVLPQNFELPFYIRLALGQAAIDEVPVPVELALAWSRLDPRISLRVPARRCPEQFEKLFAEQYHAALGPGLLLPRNRSRLKFVYRPASSGFAHQSELNLTFGDVPDVTVLAGPITKLQSVIDSATEALAPYSRFVGRNPTEAQSLDAQLLLPPSLWPENLRRVIDGLRTRIADDTLVMTFGELVALLGSKGPLSREKTRQLARVLATSGVGIEPDVLSGARPPKSDEDVILFSLPAPETGSPAQGSYLAAVLTLQLASAVASADGEFGAHETDHLRDAVLSWKHLSANHSRRLLAHLELLRRNPMTFPRLRRKLEGLDSRIRETLASFMASVAHSDGVISGDEVKLLERVYRVLGVDPERVFADLHAVAVDEKPSPSTIARVESDGLKLDPTRIAQLREDTAHVSTLLAEIFSEDDEVSTLAPVDSEDDDPEDSSASHGRILGLDEAHSSLARAISARPSWTREELLDLAGDLELMLDGALERIGEAAMDTYGVYFVEGDDPITVNAEILEKLDQ